MMPPINVPDDCAAGNAAVLTQGGVDIVNTVNNHCFDFGESGLKITLSHAGQCGDAPLWERDPGWTACIGCTAQLKSKGFGLGLLASLSPECDAGIDRNTDTGFAKSRLRVVIVSLHWGRETYTTPKAGQPSYAAKIIDLGADVVWGHHPHVLQPVQFYHGKPVLFSTGNFIFGTMGPVDPSTGIFQLEYQKTQEGVTLKRFTVIPCETQSNKDYRPYELTDVSKREKVWRMLRAKKTYADYVNLPESFIHTGIVVLDGHGNTLEEP